MTSRVEGEDSFEKMLKLDDRQPILLYYKERLKSEKNSSEKTSSTKKNFPRLSKSMITDG